MEAAGGARGPDSRRRDPGPRHPQRPPGPASWRFPAQEGSADHRHLTLPPPPWTDHHRPAGEPPPRQTSSESAVPDRTQLAAYRRMAVELMRGNVELVSARRLTHASDFALHHRNRRGRRFLPQERIKAELAQSHRECRDRRPSVDGASARLPLHKRRGWRGRCSSDRVHRPGPVATRALLGDMTQQAGRRPVGAAP